MPCPTWGRVSSEDEIKLMVGPAAVLGTILAAVARGIRPNGMSIGIRGRRVAIASAALLAISTIVCMALAIYANETCLDTIVVARTDNEDVTIVQMFWMLVPGVAAAAIISALCDLIAARLSLPRWKGDICQVNHVHRILENGVVRPRDDYGLGVHVLKRGSALWWVACNAWVCVVAIMVYTTIRGDVTNGLLNLAGLLALATNTGIPVWNESKTRVGS